MAKHYLIISALCLLPTAHCLAAVPDGYIVRVDSKTLYTDWGKASGIQVGDTFSVYREGVELKHPITHEVLGKPKEDISKAVVQRIDAKFTVASVLSSTQDTRIGDRTHLDHSSSDPSSVILPVASRFPTEAWRSEPFADEAVSMTFADVDGDGIQELVVAFSKNIQVFKIKDKKLEPFATFQDQHYRQWLSVDAGRLLTKSSDEIYATAFSNTIQRPQILVLQWTNGKLHEAGHFEGFARSVAQSRGPNALFWQNMSRGYDFILTDISSVTFESGKLTVGSPFPLGLPKDQLFGWVQQDWNGDGSPDLAYLEHGERLRVTIGDIKWSSKEIYGGTKNNFFLDQERIGSLYPRLLPYQTPSGQKELLVPHNIAELGIRLTYLRIYKKSEIVALTWNASEMLPVWTLPITGALADYAIADSFPSAPSQLWTAVIPSANKTVLIVYELPH